MTRDQAQAILEKAIRFSQAENAEVAIYGSVEESTRFANNVITQNMSKADCDLVIEAAFGNKVGTAATNDFTDDGIRTAARKAEAIAKASAPNTEYMPPVEPTEYASVDAYDPAVAKATPEERAKVIKAGAAICETAGVKSAGSYSTAAGFTAVANNKGVFAYHPSTNSRFANTVMTANSSGWSEQISHVLSKVDPVAVTETALHHARTAQDPAEIEPGDYTVIMEPAAVAEFLSFAAWSMDAKAAHEGRSAFTGKEGTKIAADSVTIYGAPADPLCPGSPFMGDGMRTPDVAWIENGVLKNLIYSRFWASKTGHAPTGWPSNFLMKGGDTTLEKMIASTDKGLLITRFWYIRFVDPMTLLLTGMTRDGFFMIENGKVTKGLKHMRFNESPLVALQNIEAIGQPVRTGEYIPCCLPAIKVKDFTLSSKTTF